MRYLKKMKLTDVITTASVVIVILTMMIDDIELGWFIVCWFGLFILSCLWLIELIEGGDEDD